MFIADNIQSTLCDMVWDVCVCVWRLGYLDTFATRRSPRAVQSSKSHARLTKQPNRESRYRSTQRMDKVIVGLCNFHVIIIPPPPPHLKRNIYMYSDKATHTAKHNNVKIKNWGAC